MGALRGVRELTRSYLLRAFRSRTSLFWNFAFPLFWLFLFAFVFGTGAGGAGGATGGEGTGGGITYLMPGLFAITTLAISFAGVSYRLISEREQGILRRYRATPVSALSVVMANGAGALVILSVSLALLGGVAWAAFGVSLAGDVWQLLLVLAAGAVAFTPMGLFLGSVVPNQQAAPAVANAIFFPIIFISGAAIPLSALPGWLQEVSRLIPLTYLVEALHAVMLRGVESADLSGFLWILGATGLVGAALDTLLFRWEQREPVRPRRLAVSLAIVGALGAALWAFGPELQTRETGWSVPDAVSAGTRGAASGIPWDERDTHPRGGAMAVDVEHQEQRGRFVVELGDGDEAYLEYHDRGSGTLEYAHTFVPESHRGEGIAEELVVAALEHARERDRRIIPSCPYVRHVMEDARPEFADLMASDDDAGGEDA